jgi:hypothetical protein
MLSETSVPSVENDHTIGADETPCHKLLVTFSMRHSWSSGTSAAPEVMMIDGSMRQYCYSSAMPRGPIISAGLSTSP